MQMCNIETKEKRLEQKVIIYKLFRVALLNSNNISFVKATHLTLNVKKIVFN